MPVPLERLTDLGDNKARANRNFDTLAAKVNPPLPQARVFGSTHAAILNSAADPISFDSEAFDQGALHSTSSNKTRLTAPITGLYIVTAAVALSTTASGRIIPRFVLNGSIEIGRGATIVSGGAESNATMLAQLTAADYLEFNLWNLSGASITPAAGGGLTWFAMARLGGFVNQGI